MYEPADLDDMTAREALDAVLADIRNHHVSPDADGFFTALRHIDLLGHLATRFTGDAHHHLDQDHDANPTRYSIKTLSLAAAATGRALAHYTQALPALTALGTPADEATLGTHLDSLPHYSALYRHLHAAEQALHQARQDLADHTPQPPGQPAPPVAKTPAPAPASRSR
ncbi:hypothetical protein T261_0851 [Streptomyces lydicus]|nr:hypothetical protein T261_0851 [Streptomyces lydicus]